MTVKLNHYWSVIPEKEKEYIKFILNRFIPGINQLGMHTVAVWTVLIGAYSEIIMENACSDLEIIEQALNNKEYKRLKQELLTMVGNYQNKVLINTGRLDSYTMDIRKDTIKFNQMWDVICHRKSRYNEFILDEYFPVLNDLGICIAGEWEVLIGDGPGIICEGRVSDVERFLNNLQSPGFQESKQKLKALVENYRSRVLAFYIQKIKGYKSVSYQMAVE